MTSTVPRVPGPATRVGERKAYQRLDRKLDELAQLRESGVIDDAEYHAMLGALSSGPGASRPQPGVSGPAPGADTAGSVQSRRRATLVAVAAVGGATALIAAAGAWLILAGGGPGALAERSGAEEAAVYGRTIAGPVQRLTGSARVSGRILAGTGSPRDLASVRRMAAQQVAVVTRARSDLAEIEVTGNRRRSLGILLRASARHREVLGTLARIDASRPSATLDRFPVLVAAARGAVADYRVALRGLPGVTVAVTSSGLADLQGVRQALERQQERLDAAAAAEAARQAEAAEAARRLREGGDARLGPVVSGFSASDLGGTVAVDAVVCDRTPGAVNDFVYTLQLRGPAFDTHVLTASQTRACNPVSFRVADIYASGAYSATLRIDNLTNGVSGTVTTTLFIS